MYNSHIDLQTNCTRDEAIAIMLGLIQGPIQSSPPDYDATPEEIEMHNSITFSLLDHLHEEHDLLQSEYAEAKFDNLSADVIVKKLAAFNQFKKLIDKAKEYSCYFDDEIAKGKLSAIRIHETDGSGAKHYTLTSVRHWIEENSFTDVAEKQYQKSQVLPPTDIEPAIGKNGSVKIQRLRAQETAIVDAIKALGYDPKGLPKREPGKAGVKAEIRKSLQESDLFTGKTVFDTAWERLRADGDVADMK